LSELYELPDGWEWRKLNDEKVCNLIMGQSPKSDTYNSNNEGMPFFQGKTEFGDTYPTVRKYCTAPKKIAEIGDILLSVRAPVGPTNIANIQCCIGRGLGAIRPNINNTLTNYLLYFFRNFELEISQKGKGSTFSAITKKELENTNIPLPPLKEQKRIVAKLDTLFKKIDKAIELHQQNIDDIDGFMASVLNEVFLELEGRYEKKQLKEIVDNYDGKRIPIKSSDRESISGKYPYYGASGIIDYVNDYIFDGEYLLISEDGANLTVRKYPIAFIADGKFWVNNHAHIVSAKNNISTNKYMEYIFAYTNISGYITGSAQPKMSQGKMNLIEFVIPPLNIQQKTVKYLDEVSQNIEKLKALQIEKKESLKALKSSLLDRAFRGEL